MSFKITWKTHIICCFITFLIAEILGDLTNLILDQFFGQEFILFPTQNILMNFYIYIILIMIPISVVHELLHGAAYMMFDGKVKFGFKGIYAYTQETSGTSIERINFLVILLTPLVTISIFSLLLPTWIGGMIYLLNLFGSSGDLYMAFILTKYNYNSKIIDKVYGFDIIN